MTIYLVLSASTSKPISLLACTKACLSLYSTSSTWRWSRCVPFNFKPFWFTLPMAYSTAKLKSYGNKASTCFQTILSRKHVTQMSSFQESAIGFTTSNATHQNPSHPVPSLPSSEQKEECTFHTTFEYPTDWLSWWKLVMKRVDCWGREISA